MSDGLFADLCNYPAFNHDNIFDGRADVYQLLTYSKNTITNNFFEDFTVVNFEFEGRGSHPTNPS